MQQNEVPFICSIAASQVNVNVFKIKTRLHFYSIANRSITKRSRRFFFVSNRSIILTWHVQYWGVLSITTTCVHEVILTLQLESSVSVVTLTSAQALNCVYLSLAQVCVSACEKKAACVAPAPSTSSS